ncbi:MAG: hypothetical protein J7M21_00195, partial [Planctomycetes bacterium]|nr:hypothetical protein [Planctomycetota bacterium]
MAKEYNITRTSGRCFACDRQMQPGEQYMATVRRCGRDGQSAPAGKDTARRAAGGTDAEPPDAEHKDTAAANAANAAKKDAAAAGEEFCRRDYCMSCWQAVEADQAGDRDVLGIWRAVMPRPREKKKTFVDDDILVGF